MKINELGFLAGTWMGNGIAHYPTIETVDYREELIFQMNDEFPVLHYEQKTWIKNDNGLFEKPIFWESGFIIEKDDETIQLCNVQKSGRIEILNGFLIRPNENQFELSLNSENIYNDARMIKSSRKFTFRENDLTYELFMSTNNNPGFDMHLKASLKMKSRNVVR